MSAAAPDPDGAMHPSVQVPLSVLYSDRVLDGVLDFLAIRAITPRGDQSVENLARWDLKAALREALFREGICEPSPAPRVAGNHGGRKPAHHPNPEAEVSS